MTGAALLREPSDLINGSWISLKTTGPGPTLESRSPAHPDQIIYTARSTVDHVDAGIAAARAALPGWARLSIDQRAAVLLKFRDLCKAAEDRLGGLICDETGKALWDAKAEASLLANKVDVTLDASATGPMRRVTGFELSLAPTRAGRCWYRAHGVMAVLGPFNFPMHLPNGHIVPALLMGNTIVFKPSDKAPACGQALVEMFDQALRESGVAASLPGNGAGVINLVQGGVEAAKRLVGHDDLDGILFTGSWPVGRAITQANLDRPGRVLALEMGGNNPAIVLPDANLKQAAIECTRSAFVSSGQRCTCTRRVIVHRGIADRLIPAILKAASNLIVADPRSPHPVFMGPVISKGARQAVLDAQAAIRKAGGRVLLESTAMETPSRGWFITPGILEVPRFVDDHASRLTPPSDNHAAPQAWSHPGADLEVFGPLLRISITDSLDDAIEQANATDFGLAASIFTHDQAAIDRFLREAKAGCVNVNTGTAGASSKLPFGGLGLSGNHRPAGAYSLDYCAIPIAGMIEQGDAALIPQGMRFEDAWVSDRPVNATP